MHKVTKITLGVGFVLLIVSAIATSGGLRSFIENMDEGFDAGGTDLWTGKTPATFEGEMNPTSMYPVFVQEYRSVDVELLNGDVNSRFVPCEEDYSCESFYEPGYTYVGDIYVSYSDTWKVRFSGDVTGDSDVMIREISIDVQGFWSFGLGCMGVCLSLLLLGVGVIFAFTLKDNNNPSSQVALVSGNTQNST
ncbi:MAG: hypothetical protein VX204_00315 [Candidatus Thermoplasmatota archaeon]|nr:hypothetical protein [Candidatus Thermoplasmatota archaeon]MEE3269541.1 hypothetical protein [Candidatus Thermoplasmatota archaeon]